MSSEYLVKDARKWADHLVMKEYQGPGQMDRAMDRASQKSGIDRNTFWSLRYRPPKDLMASVYFRLKAAYEAECKRQERLYTHEKEMTNAIAPNVVRAADYVAGKTFQEKRN